MKRFNMPCMERIDLVNEIITVASLCSTNLCCDYTCPICEEADPGCPLKKCTIVGTCSSYHCPAKLCVDYYCRGLGC